MIMIVISIILGDVVEENKDFLRKDRDVLKEEEGEKHLQKNIFEGLSHKKVKLQNSMLRMVFNVEKEVQISCSNYSILLWYVHIHERVIV